MTLAVTASYVIFNRYLNKNSTKFWLVVKVYIKTRKPAAPLAGRAPSHPCERIANMVALMVASSFATLSSTPENISWCYMEKLSMKHTIARRNTG